MMVNIQNLDNGEDLCGKNSVSVSGSVYLHYAESGEVTGNSASYSSAGDYGDSPGSGSRNLSRSGETHHEYHVSWSVSRK